MDKVLAKLSSWEIQASYQAMRDFSRAAKEAVERLGPNRVAILDLLPVGDMLLLELSEPNRLSIALPQGVTHFRLRQAEEPSAHISLTGAFTKV